MKRFFFWLELGIFLVLAEFSLFFGRSPALLVAGFIFLIFPLFFSGRPWLERLIAGLILPLAFASLSWSRLVFGELIIASLTLSYAKLRSRRRPRALSEVEVLWLLFLTLLNFFVFRSLVPVSYGLIFLAGSIFIFLLISYQLTRTMGMGEGFKFTAAIVSILVYEIIIVLNFLPHGYISLSLVTLIIYFLISRLVRDYFFRKLDYRKLVRQVTLGILIVILIFLSAGAKP